MAKQYPKNARAEAATGYPPTPDADLFQGEKPGPEGWGARGRSQQMTNAQKRTLQALVDAGIDPDHAYLITIGEQSLTQAEHNQVANNGKGRRAPPRGSSPADLDPLDGAPAGEMPVDRRVDDNFDPETGKFLGNRKDPTAPRRGDGMGEAEGYRGTIPYGEPGWDQQDPRNADERAAGRERVQRASGGAYNDEVNFLNNPDGYTLEEQRLNAQVLSPKQQEEKRRAEQDAGAELRHKQMKPKYDSQTGELLQDHQLERNGWRQTEGPDGRKRYTSTGQFPDGSSNGVESQARIDARNGIVRNKEGQVLRSPGPGGGEPVYGPDRFRGNQRPNVQPQGGGGQMAVPPEDVALMSAPPPIRTMPYVNGQQQGDPAAPPIQTLPARRDVGQGKPQPAPIALMKQSRDRRDIEMSTPPSVGGPVRNSPPVNQGQSMEGGGGPVEGDGYGPLAGGRQLGEGLNGGTHFQRQQRMQRMAARRRVSVETIAQEIAAEEAAGAASGEFGYNSGRAWEKTISRDQSFRNADASERADRFKNQAMYGPAGRAMNLVNDTQFSNDPSQAGQWHNFMKAQAMLGPQQPIVDPNAVTAQQGTQAFALASRLAGNAAFNGQQGTADAQRDARIDKAHEQFSDDTSANPTWANQTGTDTLEEREAMVANYLGKYRGLVSEQTIRGTLNIKRGAAGQVQQPQGGGGPQPGSIPPPI